jgi:DedD protein
VELLVKERLTGAIILVVLIVLLVPELLSGPKGPAATPSATGAASPSSEEPPLRSYTIHMGDDAHSQSQTANGAAGPAGPSQPSGLPQPSGPAQPTAQTGSPQATTSDSDLSESSTWDSSSATGRTNSSAATQGGSSATAPADRAEVPSKSAATARTEAPSKPAGAARTEASSKPARQAAAAQKQSKGHAPVAAPASAPAGSSESGGWGVQLGVFASRENAERLALDVRVKGFKASVSPVTSGKRKLYRVRVGPAPDRSAAQELQTKLKAAGRPGGTVVPYS